MQNKDIPEFEVVEVKEFTGFDWKNMLIFGIVFILISIVLAVFPNIIVDSIMIVFGITFVLLGIITVFYGIISYPTKIFVPALIIGITVFLLGCFLFTDWATRFLSWILFAYMIIKSITEIGLGIKYYKEKYAIGFFVNGGLSLIIAIVEAIVGFDILIGFMIAFSLFSTGVFFITSSLRYKKEKLDVVS